MSRKLRFLVKYLVLSFLFLIAAGCSFHNNWTGAGADLFRGQPGSGLSRQDQTRFWSRVRVKSDLAQSHYRLGRYYQQSGKHRLAVSEFRKAIRLDNTLVRAYNGLGVSLTALERCDEAAEVFEAGLTRTTKQAWYYNNYACSRMLCSEPELAFELLQQAAELDGASSRIANNLKLAGLLTHVGKIADSKETELRAVSGAVDGIQHLRTERGTLPSPPEGVPHKGSEKSVISPLVAVLTKNPGRVVLRRQAAKNIVVRGLEVSNGNGVTGMARRSADFFRRFGFVVGRITNADNFQYSHSLIYYRKGQFDMARAIADIIPGDQELQEVADLGRKNIQVRLLLGRDMAGMNFSDIAASITDQGWSEAEALALATDR